MRVEDDSNAAGVDRPAAMKLFMAASAVAGSLHSLTTALMAMDLSDLSDEDVKRLLDDHDVLDTQVEYIVYALAMVHARIEQELTQREQPIEL